NYMLGPGLQQYKTDLSEKPPFSPTEYVAPLKELNIFDFKTSQCQEFVKDVGGVLEETGEVGVLDPEEFYEPLAHVTKDLHTRYIDAAQAAGKNAPTDNMEVFLRSLAEDNAHGVLHSLIGLGGLTVYMADQVLPEYIGSEAIIEQRKVAGLASVGRTFAQEKIRPEYPPDWRAASVVAFEGAVLTGERMPRSATETYFVLNKGEIVSPYISLAKGHWREPQMCAGFQRYQAKTHELSKGNERFFRQTESLFNIEGVVASRRGRVSSTEMSVNLGGIVGLYSIYPIFPLQI